MVSPVHREDFVVKSYEIDPEGRITLPSLFSYLQESASNHATEYRLSMDDLRSRDLTWMISRVHLRIVRYPLWGERVVVETWPSLRQKYFAFREFICFDERGEELCRATSSWLVVDLVKNRPVVLEERGIGYDLPDRGRIIDDNFSRLPRPDEITHSIETIALRHTIDYNRHVGSVQYLRWFFDPLPGEIANNYSVSSFEIRFQYQTLLNERVRSGVKIIKESRTSNNLITLHELYNITREKIMAIARVGWAPSGNETCGYNPCPP